MRSAGSAAVALALPALVLAACGETRGTLVTTTPDGGSGTWRPAAGTSWQIQLSGALDVSMDVAVYEVDLFATSAGEMATLHTAGRRVICYVSVGTFEPWRDDAGAFPAAALGNPLADYPDESWLDLRDPTVRTLMTARLEVAQQRACDGVDLSNVSPGAADTGFPLSRSDVLGYARGLAADAHQRGLGAGLGGGSDVADALEPDFDWATTDSCLARGACAAYAPFVAANKAMLAVEFGTAADVADICPRARQANLNAIIKNRALDAFRVPCP